MLAFNLYSSLMLPPFGVKAVIKKKKIVTTENLETSIFVCGF